MAFKDDYEFDLLVNEVEKMVISVLEEELKKIEDTEGGDKLCKCQDCILDMCALALNNIKPYYRSSFTGRVYAQGLIHNKEYKDTVIKAITDAINKVKKNPSHVL